MSKPTPQRRGKLMANLANQDYKSKVGALDWLGIKASIPDIRTWKPRSWRANSAGMTPSLVSIYIYINLWGLLFWINFSVTWPSLLLINTLLFIFLGILPLISLLCFERELALNVYDGMNICRHLHIVYCLSIYLSEKPQVISFIWPWSCSLSARLLTLISHYVCIQSLVVRPSSLLLKIVLLLHFPPLLPPSHTNAFPFLSSYNTSLIDWYVCAACSHRRHNSLQQYYLFLLTNNDIIHSSHQNALQNFYSCSKLWCHSLPRL